MAKADTVASQAYASWELKQFSEAVGLFLEASRIEAGEAKSRSKWAAPNSSVLHRLRAGFCLFEDGKTEQALELVEEGMEFDWKSARLWADRRDAEKCHICFILHFAYQRNQPSYSSHVARAVKDGERLGIQFPWSKPVTKKALAAALAMSDRKNLAEWVTSIDAETRRSDPELGLLCRQAECAAAK